MELPISLLINYKDYCRGIQIFYNLMIVSQNNEIPQLDSIQNLFSILREDYNHVLQY